MCPSCLCFVFCISPDLLANSFYASIQILHNMLLNLFLLWQNITFRRFPIWQLSCLSFCVLDPHVYNIYYYNPLYFYYMVTQNMLRTREGKKFFFRRKQGQTVHRTEVIDKIRQTLKQTICSLNLIICLKQIKNRDCSIRANLFLSYHLIKVSCYHIHHTHTLSKEYVFKSLYIFQFPRAFI